MSIKTVFKSNYGEIKMKLTVKTDSRLDKALKINVNDVIQQALIQSSLLVQNRAKDIAPYLSWTLKRSISVNYWYLWKLYTIIWSSLPYAKRRHRENKKNPQTLRYLFRWYDEMKSQIDTIFTNAMKKVFI